MVLINLCKKSFYKATIKKKTAKRNGKVNLTDIEFDEKNLFVLNIYLPSVFGDKITGEVLGLSPTFVDAATVNSYCNLLFNPSSS